MLCCVKASGPTEAQREVINKFVKIATEEDDEKWVNHSRKQDGPKGTMIESKQVGGYTYWRGSAKFPVSMDLVVWFLGNQLEYNALASTIDKEVLGPKVSELYSRNKTAVTKVKRKGVMDQSTLQWKIEMPGPVAPREFIVKERQLTLRDGARVMVSQSVKKKSGEQHLPGVSDLSEDHHDSTKFHSSIGSGSHLSSGGGFNNNSNSKSQSSMTRPFSGKLGRPKSAKTDALAVSAALSPESPSSHNSNSKSSSVDGAGSRKSGFYAPTPQEKLKGKRGNVLVSGYLVTPVHGGRACEVTYVSCIDPMLTDDDYESMAVFAGKESEEEGQQQQTVEEQKELIMELLGKSRVLQGVESVRRYWEDPKSYWTQQLFRLASAKVGQFGFEKLDNKRFGEEKMQTGTHVTHKSLGHGVIKQFDLRGEAQVVFDNGQTRTFSTNQLEKKLSASVEIGTRVMHPTRGFGTVKHFDEERIHVKFDSGEYHRYKGDSWKKKMTLTGEITGDVDMAKCRQVDLQGVTDDTKPINAGVTAANKPRRRTLSLIKLETKKKKKKNQPKSIKAEVQRITFTIAAPSNIVRDYILCHKEEEKTGLIVEEKTLKQHSPSHVTQYQRIKFPQGLNDRDCVFDRTWSEVDKDAFIIVSKSTVLDDCPPSPGVVRADLVIRGYLIEPLYDTCNLVPNQTLYSRITYITCFEPNGFVPPKVVESMNRTELIGVVTDMRAHFYRKQNIVVETIPVVAGSVAMTPKRISHGAKSKIERRSFRRASTLDLSSAPPGDR